MQTFTDAVVVGYGQTSISSSPESCGQICIWAFQNFFWPLKSLSTKRGVTAIAVSEANLLAAGLLDGSLLLFDLGHSQVSTATF